MVGFHACSSYGTSDAEVGHLYKSMEKEEHGQASTTIKNGKILKYISNKLKLLFLRIESILKCNTLSLRY